MGFKSTRVEEYKSPTRVGTGQWHSFSGFTHSFSRLDGLGQEEGSCRLA